jgi:hypothetical protein
MFFRVALSSAVHREATVGTNREGHRETRREAYCRRVGWKAQGLCPTLAKAAISLCGSFGYTRHGTNTTLGTMQRLAKVLKVTVAKLG